MKRIFQAPFLLAMLFALTSSMAQNHDSTVTHVLKPIQVNARTLKTAIDRLPEMEGTILYAGKKNEIIRVSNLDADLSTNNSRQIFSKVPGISIWENDGSGIQTGIAARGLSPNRSWEFNVRQNGYEISSDVFGYPETYFTPPSEAVERIDLVRGAASLQFGPQFGGLLNYHIKKGPGNKAIAVESQQTAGSYGLFNSFNAIGGTVKRLSYYTYFHNRSADGWRQYSRYRTSTGYASLQYAISKKLNLGLEYTAMNYQSQQPGGLTDQDFLSDPQSSSRARNWFSAPWNIGSLSLNYNYNAHTTLSVKIFGTSAQRNSVGYTKPIQIADSINLNSGTYNNRQVDKDGYQNIGTEVRFLKKYRLLKNISALAAGIRLYKGHTLRLQSGIGSTGSDMDFRIAAKSTGKDYAKELSFTTSNMALFAENMFKLSPRFSITPGLRLEILNSGISGYINPLNAGKIEPNTIKRKLLLLGIGSEYKVSDHSNIYFNFSQAYRPVTFSELSPSATTDVIDPNLKDARGYNLDFGYRGKIKDFVNFDVGGFYLLYNNRIGSLMQNNAVFKTNIGNSESKGIEALIEFDPILMLTKNSKIGNVRVFASVAYVDAKYTQWNNPAIANDPLTSIEGKRVENAPKNIERYGLNYMYKHLSISFQYNKTGSVYTDAANTEKANTASTIGKLPAYTVLDLSATYVFNEKYNLKAGIDNMANEAYSTRRAGGYPGPGLLPSNGRTWFLGFGLKL